MLNACHAACHIQMFGFESHLCLTSSSLLTTRKVIADGPYQPCGKTGCSAWLPVSDQPKLSYCSNRKWTSGWKRSLSVSLSLPLSLSCCPPFKSKSFLKVWSVTMPNHFRTWGTGKTTNKDDDASKIKLQNSDHPLRQKIFLPRHMDRAS